MCIFFLFLKLILINWSIKKFFFVNIFVFPSIILHFYFPDLFQIISKSFSFNFAICSIFFFFVKRFYLNSRVTQRERWSHFSPAGSLSKWLQKSGLGQVLHLGRLHGFRGLCLGYLLLLSQGNGWEVGHEPGIPGAWTYAQMGCCYHGLLTQYITILASVSCRKDLFIVVEEGKKTRWKKSSIHWVTSQMATVAKAGSGWSKKHDNVSCFPARVAGAQVLELPSIAFLGTTARNCIGSRRARIQMNWHSWYEIQVSTNGTLTHCAITFYPLYFLLSIQRCQHVSSKWKEIYKYKLNYGYEAMHS